MKKLIHVDARDLGSLRCDTDWCGYVLDKPLPWSRELIGHACPQCGQSMLTVETYKKVERMLWWFRVVNFLFSWCFGTKRPPDDGATVEVDIREGNKTNFRVLGIGE